MFSLLLEDVKTYPDWIVNSFPIIRVVIMSLIVLLAIAIIVIVMCMQSNPEGGTNVISGQSESFYSKNQGSSKEGRLKTAVAICGIALAVLAVVFWIMWAVFPLTK